MSLVIVGLLGVIIWFLDNIHDIHDILQEIAKNVVHDR